MRDTRTKRQKLEDMANQSVSPNEAEIARNKLKELKPDAIPTGVVFINGKPEVSHIIFSFDLNTDPGTGVYDFVKEEWTWYPREKE